MSKPLFKTLSTGTAWAGLLLAAGLLFLGLISGHPEGPWPLYMLSMLFALIVALAPRGVLRSLAIMLWTCDALLLAQEFSNLPRLWKIYGLSPHW